MKTKIFLILIFIVSSLLLIGCADSPEKAAKEWFTAILNSDREKILDRTCQTYENLVVAEEYPKIALSYASYDLWSQLMWIDLQSFGDASQIEYTLFDTEGAGAYVHVHGVLKVTNIDLVQEYPINELWYMIKINVKDTWKFCGNASRMMDE